MYLCLSQGGRAKGSCHPVYQNLRKFGSSDLEKMCNKQMNEPMDGRVLQAPHEIFKINRLLPAFFCIWEMMKKDKIQNFGAIGRD